MATQTKLTRFKVTFEIHGRAFTLNREAFTYRDMVHHINQEFGNALILKTRNL